MHSIKLKNCQRSMKKYFKAVQIISIRAEILFLFSKEMTECKEWKKTFTSFTRSELTNP